MKSITDCTNVEHILKSNFQNYTKVFLILVNFLIYFVLVGLEVIFIMKNLDDLYLIKSSYEAQGDYHKLIMRDFFCKWDFCSRWRYMASPAEGCKFEFPTKVSRDCSAAVFMSNTAKLVKKVSESAVNKKIISLQVL
ncbi:hypothetical protein R6Q57_021342 [Mikania cordata]